MTARAFLFDANRCTGCQACELACSIENGLDGFSWRQVVTLNEAHHPAAPTIHLSLACNHCAEPPCMEHCPALAYSKDPVSGEVKLAADRCIGCGYCSWACPYDAPRFDGAAGVMTKCTFCSHRQAAGREPACVEQCPTGALAAGDLAALPGVSEAPGMPTLAPGPAIRFIPWRAAAEVAGGASPAAGCGGRPASARKISLRSEWPLVGFSLIAALLVAIFTAATAGALELAPVAFLGLAAAGLGLSTAHLGRPLRAWRALANVRSSWLSREIALFSAFLALAGAHFLLPDAAWLAVAAVAVGAAGLFAVDRVYDLVRPAESRRLHSADVLLTGALLCVVLLGEPWWTAVVALTKAGLYLQRKLRRARAGKSPRWRWSLARLGAGLVAPAAAALSASGGWVAWALAGSAVGEVIDRCELYGELEVPTPRDQMARELERRLGGRSAARQGSGNMGG